METQQPDYIQLNRESWNKRTDHHVRSAFYDVDSFKKGRSSLNKIELDLLGDVKGKSILHLQCHFGQDTLSLARMGAEVTGMDFSDKAIAEAKKLSRELNLPAEFICCDLYSLPQHLDKEFDIVFTSYGTIGWLPDMQAWASIVSRYLKPGGQFVMAEFHPVVWMYNDKFTALAYSYFNTGPIIEEESGTYADRNADLRQEYIGWNHSLSEVVNSLIGSGIALTSLHEYNYSPYNSFHDMQQDEEGRYYIAALGDKAPLVYAVTGARPQ